MKRFGIIFNEADPEPIELMLGLLGIIWGIDFFWPGVSLIKISPAYYVWGISFFIYGVLQLSVLTFFNHNELKKRVLLFSILVWAFLDFIILFYSSSLLGLLHYTLFTLCGMWAYRRRAYGK